MINPDAVSVLDTDQFWDAVVGIPLDDWVRAKTTDQLRQLTEWRDQGHYARRPLVETGDWFDVVDDTGRVLRRFRA